MTTKRKKAKTEFYSGQDMKAKGFTLYMRGHNPALVRDDAPVWIVEFEAAKHLRPRSWRVYRACEKVRPGANAWSADNVAIDGDANFEPYGFLLFQDAVDAARNWDGVITPRGR
jgi:hypothetical protein